MNREMERRQDREARIVEMDVESYGEQPLSVLLVVEARGQALKSFCSLDSGIMLG